MIAKVKSREHAKRTKVSVKGHKTPTHFVGEGTLKEKTRREETQGNHKKNPCRLPGELPLMSWVSMFPKVRVRVIASVEGTEKEEYLSTLEV
jgi:hypothetical protein